MNERPWDRYPVPQDQCEHQWGWRYVSREGDKVTGQRYCPQCGKTEGERREVPLRIAATYPRATREGAR